MRSLTLAVYNGDDSLRMRFEYADGRMPVSMTAGGQRYYLAYDQVGSPKIVANSFGTVVKRIEYDTFGNILTDSDPLFEIPFGFAGGLCDRSTGLVRFGFRDYDPDTGRWTAKDPIGFAGGDTDLFGYCFNDPVNLIDYSGLDSLYFDGSNVHWVNDSGLVLESYSARSGPWGNSSLPPGLYTGSNLRSRTINSMSCPDTDTVDPPDGWSLDLDPDFDTERDNLRIHPDGNVLGSLGCIAVACGDADDLYDMLSDYLSENESIEVTVSYEMY